MVRARPFPWEAVMTLGLSRLRLSPQVFWQLTLPELAAMAGGSDRSAAISRRDVEALMARFPD
ncbi:rcc01693 family protein [Rhizobium sp. AAP43]|uniref:rcc01693 family protein n=1 Tax=Rhizobium sp. AAP43 TaxID=1523420 RepID=UPI0018D1602F|nr:rcc01693 family protein [Rhizobium sp. AAP43]